MLTLQNFEMIVAMRRRLGIAVCFEGSDPHGHASLTTNLGGRLNARHKVLVAAWRQVFYEAGGAAPNHNVERTLTRTNVPVPPGDLRRLDLIVPGLNVLQGLPVFCDATVVTPLSFDGAPRGGTSNRGGSLLAQSVLKEMVVCENAIASLIGQSVRWMESIRTQRQGEPLKG